MTASGAGTEPSLPEKVTAIHEALRAAKLAHAIGGALALAYYAEPRATIDIDLNLFVPADRWPEVKDALGPLGVGVDAVDSAEVERDGQCRLWWGDNAVDLFFAHHELHEEMPAEVRRVPFAGGTIPIVAPEHLAVFKALLDRTKDWLDIEQMLVATDDVDVDAIEDSLVRIVGEGDRRLDRFRKLKVGESLD